MTAIPSPVMMSENSGINEENMEESPIESEFNEITPEQACNNLQLLWGLARSKEAKIIYVKDELAIQEKISIFEKGKVENLLMDKIRLEAQSQHKAQSQLGNSLPRSIKWPGSASKSNRDQLTITVISQLCLKLKKAEHYVIDRLANRPIKVVIKGLPMDTDVADIEADLVQKGFAIEKVAQLRKLSTKAPLPIFMVEVRRTETVQNIHDVKTVCYLCVGMDPFRRKPGVTQCYNCNYFNHSSKNCRMNPRCLKCGNNHRTGECNIKEKIEKPKCINCNEEGHVASLRSCSAFPKIKPKKGDPIPSNNKTRNKVNTLPKTRPVESGLCKRLQWENQPKDGTIRDHCFTRARVSPSYHPK
ncbi:nucleic-acid-binding protein from transposon X-element [Trichonephila clavipes]|nr:nucleic-acid-binding protein from transposon X-element [Trichonephila clavipes]